MAVGFMGCRSEPPSSLAFEDAALAPARLSFGVALPQIASWRPGGAQCRHPARNRGVKIAIQSGV